MAHFLCAIYPEVIGRTHLYGLTRVDDATFVNLSQIIICERDTGIMKPGTFGTALAALTLGYLGNIELNHTPMSASLDLSLSLEGAPASAGRRHGQTRRVARRTARRTTRRTTRRVARRHSIAGCSLYNAYYNCGGVYYSPIVEGGSTTYVVVNP